MPQQPGYLREEGQRSLLAWLRRHGHHVHHLRLGEFGGRSGALGMTVSCLAACAAAGQLESLQAKVSLLGYDVEFVIGAWAAGLTRLQRLDLTGRGLRVTTSLHALTALRKLRLHAGDGGVDLAPGVQLPLGIEELDYRDYSYRFLPEQARVCGTGMGGWAGSGWLACARVVGRADAQLGLQRLPSACATLQAPIPRNLTAACDPLLCSLDISRLCTRWGCAATRGGRAMRTGPWSA